MKDEKKKKFIQVFAIALIMLLIASASYAYFAARVSEASSTDIIVNTSTVDSLTFETGDAISISATQSNFGSGAGNQSGSTYASATLVANNDTNEASANYYLYIKIDINEFDYTISDRTAELILTITDPDGYEVTSLSGLTYTSVTDGDGTTVSGFDITTKTGLITVASEYVIESNGTNTQEWNIEVILINLDSDQSDNAGKSFSASLVIKSTVYGNNLQAFEYGSIWAYSDSITKIVFDDGGNTISDYEEVYDITNDGYCYYDGAEVYNYGYDSLLTEDSCSNVYRVTDNDYTVFFDNSFTSYIIEYGEVAWDSDEGVCETSDGYIVYTWFYGNNPTEEQCSGTVYYVSGYDEFIFGIESVGSGEWEDANNYSNINAYLVNNGDSTYTVYIESDAPILGNQDMRWWLGGFESLESIEGLDKLITANVINMEGMFYNCSSLTSLDLSNFDTSNVTYMSWMFEDCNNLTSLDLSAFDTSSVITMEAMFYNCSSLTSLDLSNFDTSNVISMSSMFYFCKSLKNLDLSNFDTSSVIFMSNMSNMFDSCSSLITLDLSNFDTSNVVSMHQMFNSCSSLITLDLGNFDTSNVETMRYMFNSCSSLTSLDLNSFDTSNVTNMERMFASCNSLTLLDMSNADFSSVTSYTSMFYNNSSSIIVTVKDETAQSFIKARLGSKGTVVIA